MALTSKDLEARYINRWLIEYVYHLSWSEFSKNGKITPRVLINGVLEQPVTSHARTREMVRIVELLCLLADGENYDLYKTEDEKTVLELALDCIQEMGFEGILGADALAWLIKEIQKQAIYVCCQKLDYTIGRKVYDRLWKDAEPETPEEEETKKEMNRLSAGHRRQTRSDFPSYRDFLKDSLKQLEPLHQKHKDPFLLMAAREISQYMDKKINTSPKKITVKPSILKSVQKDYDLGDSPNQLHLDKKQKKELDAKIVDIQKNRRKYLSRLSEYTGYSAANAEDMEDENKLPVVMGKQRGKRGANDFESDENSPKRSRVVRTRAQKEKGGARDLARSPKFRSPSKGPQKEKGGARDLAKSPKLRSPSKGPQRVRRSGRSIDGSSSGDESYMSCTSAASRVKNGGSSNGSKKKLYDGHDWDNAVPLRRAWTEEEEQLLVYAVSKCGVGNWAKMREMFDFGTRTNVNLKDKWRTMIKTGDREIKYNIKG